MNMSEGICSVTARFFSSAEQILINNLGSSEFLSTKRSAGACGMQVSITLAWILRGLKAYAVFSIYGGETDASDTGAWQQNLP